MTFQIAWKIWIFIDYRDTPRKKTRIPKKSTILKSIEQKTVE